MIYPTTQITRLRTYYVNWVLWNWFIQPVALLATIVLLVGDAL
jgi:hypothetical protein